jgi:hypothetical protein
VRVSIKTLLILDELGDELARAWIPTAACGWKITTSNGKFFSKMDKEREEAYIQASTLKKETTSTNQMTKKDVTTNKSQHLYLSSEEAHRDLCYNSKTLAANIESAMFSCRDGGRNEGLLIHREGDIQAVLWRVKDAIDYLVRTGAMERK